MAAKVPIIIVSRTSISAKYTFGDRLTGEPAEGWEAGASASCQEASTTTGISTTVMPMSTSAIPSTPSA